MTYKESSCRSFERIDSVSFPVDYNDSYDDNLIKEPEETTPPLCPYCGFYRLEDRAYQNKSVKFCKKDGYLCPQCYCKLPGTVSSTSAAIVRCPKGHEL